MKATTVTLAEPIRRNGREISSLRLVVPNARRRAALAREVLRLEGVAAARATVRGMASSMPPGCIDQLGFEDLLNAASAGLDLLDQPHLWAKG